jgi:uncharacterized protein YndB with AHSA1/START domain
MKPQITVETHVNAPVEKTWKYWTAPENIIDWCFASDNWHAPRAENDLRVGGVFSTRMEARDGSAGFDFGGTYTEIELNKKIAYTMNGEDERKVSIEFIEEAGGCRVIETFEAEDTNPLPMQQNGWQSILDNFKKHVEA